MGFREGAFATIWEITDEKKYASVKLSISRKDKESGEYKKDFSGIVRFIGNAYKTVKNRDPETRIKLGACDVTNHYDKEKERLYTNYAVFECEVLQAQKKNKDLDEETKNDEISSDEEDLPF